MLSHADVLIYPPTLRCRTMPSLHPYVALERSSPPMSSVPEPPHWTLGHVPLPARMPTLLVPQLSAYLQRPHPHAVGRQQAVARTLDSRHLVVVPLVFIAAHRQSTGRPYPYDLPLALQ